MNKNLTHEEQMQILETLQQAAEIAECLLDAHAPNTNMESFDRKSKTLVLEFTKGAEKSMEILK